MLEKINKNPCKNMLVGKVVRENTKLEGIAAPEDYECGLYLPGLYFLVDESDDDANLAVNYWRLQVRSSLCLRSLLPTHAIFFLFSGLPHDEKSTYGRQTAHLSSCR